MTSATPIAPWRSTSARMSAASSVGARALERRRRHAARGGDAERERQRRGHLGQRDDAGDAEHVGDLVRVGGDGGRPVREHGADELVDPQLRRLEVHVGVDEPRRQRGPADVDHLERVALAPPGDHAVGDRQRRVDPLARGGAEHPPAADQQVGGLVTPRYRDRSCGRRRPGHREGANHPCAASRGGALQGPAPWFGGPPRGEAALCTIAIGSPIHPVREKEP